MDIFVQENKSKEKIQIFFMYKNGKNFQKKIEKNIQKNIRKKIQEKIQENIQKNIQIFFGFFFLDGRISYLHSLTYTNIYYIYII